MKRACTLAVVITFQLLWAGAASAKGDWVKVRSKNFLLGTQQTGSFRFLIVVEALP